jgi:hypothetical protein
MGILQRIRSGASPEVPLLEELAEIATRHRELAARLARHGARCAYPNIARGLGELAARAAEQARELDALLRERNVWSRLPDDTSADGASNWERLSSDLALLLELSRAMNRQALQWETIDAVLARRLRDVALADNRDMSELRELALKCDPQALD